MRKASSIMARMAQKWHGASTSSLDGLVLLDQLAAIRRSVLLAMPVNMLLGVACLLVGLDHHEGETAAIWFTASTLVNLGRIHLCRRSLDVEREATARGGSRSGDSTLLAGRHLRQFWLGALLSGFVWAGVPFMCAGYTSSATLFYLTVVCGVTAGAVIHGTAYARVPLAFITPPLLAAIACLLYHGTFDRYCLAATIFLYLAALWRSGMSSESVFRQSSQIKNQATSLAHSLEQAHRQALEAEEHMRHLAWHDHLTGLLNRTGFMAGAEHYMPASTTPVCLMMLDLDGFKVVNDIYGHRQGDEVLAEVARRLSEQQPADALVARLGGDEFAILYTPEAGGESVEALAERLIATVPHAIANAGRLGISIGIHVARASVLTDMLTCADEALYAAKGAGRNHFRVFDALLQARLEIRRAIERDFPQAVADRTLEVFFQPILRDGGARLDSVEALLRWQHPVHGWIAPPDIVFIADTSGQSQALLEHVLDHVCALMQRLQREGFGHVRVAMNLSPRKIAQIQVDSIVFDKLAAMELSPSMLEIEVTEETTTDIDIVQHRLGRLSEAGVHIVVDDFGAGFSSLATLRHPYVSKVKIDRSLVSGLSQDRDNQLLVESILKLGQLLAIEVVAEGVEHESELRMLRSLGCELMQGFHLAMPMPMDALMEWVRHGAPATMPPASASASIVMPP